MVILFFIFECDITLLKIKDPKEVFWCRRNQSIFWLKVKKSKPCESSMDVKSSS